MPSTLHLVGLPHTLTTPEYSHCAYTGKVLRFSQMMRVQGYKIIHYGNAGSTSGADEQVDILSKKQFFALGGKLPGSSFIGNIVATDSDLYKTFNKKLFHELHDRLEQRDIICLPFGHAHADAINQFPNHQKVETGVGYPTITQRFCVFESHAWYHWHRGDIDRKDGDLYHWVIPNYYDILDWKLGGGGGGYVLFFGRITEPKGIETFVEVAKRRPDLKFVMCGQGDPKPWLAKSKNLVYEPPIHGKGRSKMLGDAMAVLMPTAFLEPFGGVAVEAQLCGTPVLSTPYGAFTETIKHGSSGFHCHTLGDWLAGLEIIESDSLNWNRPEIARSAKARYDMHVLGPKYKEVFELVDGLWDKGGDWYRTKSAIGPVTKAVEPKLVIPKPPKLRVIRGGAKRKRR